MEQIGRRGEPGPHPTKNSGHGSIPNGLACHCAGGEACDIEQRCFQFLSARDINSGYHAACDQIIDNPLCWRGHRALATAMMHQHRPQFAIKHFELALRGFLASETNTDFIKVLRCETARAYLVNGQITKAKELFATVEKHFPDYLPAKSGIADCDNRQNAKGERGYNGHPLLNKGADLERAGDYAGAWNFYVQAKRHLSEQGFTYDRAAVEKRFGTYRAFCTRATMNMLHHIAVQDDTISSYEPIFVFGYPRSGTTLLEQIISSHPNVRAGDELPFIVELVNSCQRFLSSRRPFPYCLSELIISDTEIALGELRYHYLERVRERMGDAEQYLFTDKMPLNECYLPLIHLLFPNSPKILIRRNPLDVIVSNFSLFLTHGSHQSETPATCADHITRVDNLVDHYKRKIPHLKLLEISYENLVNPSFTAMTVSGIAAHCGLKPDPAMLHPERNPRYAKTASFAQVREPISEKAVGRWKRFGPQLRVALAGTQAALRPELLKV